MYGSMKAYARHRGVDPMTVMQAIREGRIIRLSNGQINFEDADRRWEENTAPRMDDSIKRLGSEAAPTVSAYAKARAMKEAYAAQLTKLEYETKAGKLINAEDVRDEWTQICVSIRTAIQGLPQKVSQNVFAAQSMKETHDILERECREILRQISSSIRSRAEREDSQQGAA